MHTPINVNAHLNIMKNTEQRIIGVELIGTEDKNSKIFCQAFIRDLLLGKAEIHFFHREIIFDILEGENEGMVARFALTENEIFSLKAILTPDVRLKNESIDIECGGFRIFLDMGLKVQDPAKIPCAQVMAVLRMSENGKRQTEDVVEIVKHHMRTCKACKKELKDKLAAARDAHYALIGLVG